jgi:hypothetical protein
MSNYLHVRIIAIIAVDEDLIIGVGAQVSNQQSPFDNVDRKLWELSDE